MKDVNRIAHFIVLREQGKTYQEIGEMYGISKQRVEKCIKDFNDLVGDKPRNIECIPYKGIYEYLKNNPKISVTSLIKEITNYTNITSRERIRNLFKGTNTQITIKEIKKLIEITGKPFEELFELREKNSDREC